VSAVTCMYGSSRSSHKTKALLRRYGWRAC